MTTARVLLAAIFALCLTTAGNGTAAAAATLQLGGPDNVVQPGNHTYGAYLGAFYVSFSWHVRTCPTASVDGCAATWGLRRTFYTESGFRDSYTQNLARDCAGGGTRTFQVRVTASGFATPQQTKYKVTNLCYELP